MMTSSKVLRLCLSQVKSRKHGTKNLLIGRKPPFANNVSLYGACGSAEGYVGLTGEQSRKKSTEVYALSSKTTSSRVNADFEVKSRIHLIY